jgi:hypothetical protein
MPDITMCYGINCHLKEKCYRYKATPTDWQCYFTESPIKKDGTCSYLVGFGNLMKKKITKYNKKQIVTNSNELSSPKTSDN